MKLPDTPENWKGHHYELVDHSNGDKVIAEIWWDGKKVNCSDLNTKNMLSHLSVRGYKMTDGLNFVQNLPWHFRSGYTELRKKKKGK